jgi:hypothetical protein
VDEIEPPSSPVEWKPAMRQRILAARDVLLRHSWTPAVFESRSNAPEAVLQHYDSMLKLMLESGFSMDLAHHALHALGSRMLGFTQELFVNGNEEMPPEMSAIMLHQMAARYSHLGQLMKAIHHDTGSVLGSGCDDQFEFEFGLDLVLDGLERLREAGWRLSS